MSLLFGTAYWAFIQTPNTKFEPQWTIDVIPDNEEDLELGLRIKKINAKEAVVMRRKTHKNNGAPNKQPKLVDANKNPIDVQVGNGSRVCVQYEYYEGKGSHGPYQGMDLKAVQVLDLVSFGGADGEEFQDFDPDSEL
jgi:hypothetical protein